MAGIGFHRNRMPEVLMVSARSLFGLAAQYEELRLQNAVHGGGEARRRLDEAACSLCEAAGTTDIDVALAAARHQRGAVLPWERRRGEGIGR
jgi:hypothetical protein